MPAGRRLWDLVNAGALPWATLHLQLLLSAFNILPGFLAQYLAAYKRDWCYQRRGAIISAFRFIRIACSIAASLQAGRGVDTAFAAALTKHSSSQSVMMLRVRRASQMWPTALTCMGCDRVPGAFARRHLSTTVNCIARASTQNTDSCVNSSIVRSRGCR